ncbi:MAG: YcxB family protein [Acetobacteraceae bacterium]
MAAIAYELTKDDHVALHLHCHTRPHAVRRRWRVAGVLAAGMVAAPWIGGLIGGGGRIGPPFTETVLPLGIATAVLAAIWLVSLPWITRWTLSTSMRRWLRRAPASAYGPMRLSAGADGLHAAGAFGEQRAAWQTIAAIVETPEHIYLMQGETQAFVIPKRDVPKAERAAFLAEVMARTGLPITPARG